MLSFIIPIFKSEKYLDKSIKSLVNQSLKDWEAIFVLDGPSPEARQIIKHSIGNAKHEIIEIEHGGAPRARNAGFNVAKGEYIIYWDSDCIIEPHAAKAWIDVFEKHPEVGFIYGGYKFLDEKGAVNSEPWDYWLLKIRNYISTCFPLRRSLNVPWDEELKSLQDWDFWLTVCKESQTKGWDINKIGLYKNGYAWSTPFPETDSISGQGCTSEKWLERVRAVQHNHYLNDKDICITSVEYKQDAIKLAKYIEADYQDYPNIKPHEYKAIIQVGFSSMPNRAEACANNLSNPHAKNYLFWMGSDIDAIYNFISFKALQTYRILLNSSCTQFVEDKIAFDMMTVAGFQTRVMPMPFQGTNDKPLPKKPCFAVDICGEYGPIFNALEKSIPDIELEVLNGEHKIEDFTGILHFYTDRSMSNSIKRMMLAGRHVISNVEAPFCGFVNDKTTSDLFIPAVVEKLRAVIKRGLNEKGKDYYSNLLKKDKLMEALNEHKLRNPVLQLGGVAPNGSVELSGTVGGA